MSTRSFIGVKNQDGSVDYIYCHHDGYVSHNGRILRKCYNSENQVRDLIALGDISALSVDRVIAYHRDMDEELNVSHIGSEKEYNEHEDIKCRYIEYYYLWKDGKWFVNGKKMTNQLIAKNTF